MREELQTLPDPRFEGPDSETVAADMARIKAMEKAQPFCPRPGSAGPAQNPPSAEPQAAADLAVAPRRSALAAPEDAAKAAEPAPVAEPAQPAASRVVDGEYAAALLAELLAENDEVAVFTAWDNKEYYHCAADEQPVRPYSFHSQQ